MINRSDDLILNVSDALSKLRKAFRRFLCHGIHSFAPVHVLVSNSVPMKENPLDDTVLGLSLVDAHLRVTKKKLKQRKEKRSFSLSLSLCPSFTFLVFEVPGKVRHLIKPIGIAFGRFLH